MVQAWKQGGEATICLKCPGEGQLLALHATAAAQGERYNALWRRGRGVLSIDHTRRIHIRCECMTTTVYSVDV